MRLRMDARANHGPYIPQREVLFMIEPRQQSRPRLPDTSFLMTAETNSPRRQVVIFEPRRGCNRGMASDADQPLRQLQVQLMRKRPLGDGRARTQDQKGNFH